MNRTLLSVLHATVFLCLGAKVTHAQTNQTAPVRVDVYSTTSSIGVEWHINGDANHNSAATLRYRPLTSQVTGAWKDALPLVRFDAMGANVLAGSVFFLNQGSTYEIEMTLSDAEQ